MDPPHYDVAVIGAGIVGSWTAYHLTRAGRKVVLIDQVRLLRQYLIVRT